MTDTCELQAVADDMNTIAAFLGARDVTRLTPDELQAHYGWRRADVMALFGGSIIAGGDVLADAIRAGVAGTYVIVGGAGHTTATLRERVRGLVPEIDVSDDAPEAEVFAAYLRCRYGLEPDLLERRSTNCGNNITYLRDLLAKEGVPCSTLILSQDATMQRRMWAGALKEMPGVVAINYATYAARVVLHDGELSYADAPLGMWDIVRYRTLLMGEVPRLIDDEGGYGPKGSGYIAHVDVPAKVIDAWLRLRERYPDQVRLANPAFAS